MIEVRDRGSEWRLCYGLGCFRTSLCIPNIANCMSARTMITLKRSKSEFKGYVTIDYMILYGVSHRTNEQSRMTESPPYSSGHYSDLTPGRASLLHGREIRRRAGPALWRKPGLCAYSMTDCRGYDCSLRETSRPICRDGRRHDSTVTGSSLRCMPNSWHRS
jgi:hypothetical protein